MEKTQKRFSRIRSLLGNIEGKVALKTAIAATLSLVLGLAFSHAFDRPNSLVSGLWCVMASIVVIQAYIGGTYQAAWSRFVGVLVGSTMGGAAIILMGSGAMSLGVGIFFTIIICSLFHIKESLRIASLSTAVIVVLAGLQPLTNPWIFSLYRFLDSCLGILIAIFVAHFILPERALENMRRNSMQIVGLLSRCYRASVEFEPVAETYRQSNEALFSEVSELLQKNRNFRDVAAAELFNKEVQRDHWTLFTHQLEIIYDAIIILRSIKKDVLSTIFDDALVKQVDAVIDNTDMALQNLGKQLNEEPYQSFSEKLMTSLKNLNEELLRFRETRTTRKFNFVDVESFFVFFYQIRYIAEAITQAEEFAEKL